MNPTAHHQDESTGAAARLYVALELSAQAWRLAYSVSMRAGVTQVVIPAGDRVGVGAGDRGRGREACDWRRMFAVWSCYEAGRDAFWVHRWLAEAGVHNVVVDSASIEVNRRARQAKTDRLDAAHLLRLVDPVGQRRAGRVAGGAGAVGGRGRCATPGPGAGDVAAGADALPQSSDAAAGDAACDGAARCDVSRAGGGGADRRRARRWAPDW